MNLLPLLPGIIDPLYDNYRIRQGKSDSPLWIRIFAIGLCSIQSVEKYFFTISFSSIALALIPYVYFDLFLNKLRGKAWDYNGQTKSYDKFLARYNPHAVLIARSIIAGVLFYCFIKLR